MSRPGPNGRASVSPSSRRSRHRLDPSRPPTLRPHTVLPGWLSKAVVATKNRLHAITATKIFDDPATLVGGNPRGDVSIVEFFDYRCPYCKQVLPSLQTLLKEDRILRF